MNFELVKFNHLCIHPVSEAYSEFELATSFACICFRRSVSIRRDQNADHARKVACDSRRSGNPYARSEELRRVVPEGRWLENNVPFRAPWGRWWTRHRFHLRCAYVPQLVRFSCWLIGDSSSCALQDHQPGFWFFASTSDFPVACKLTCVFRLFVLCPSPNRAPRAKHKVGVRLRNVIGYHLHTSCVSTGVNCQNDRVQCWDKPTQHLMQEDRSDHWLSKIQFRST